MQLSLLGDQDGTGTVGGTGDGPSRQLVLRDYQELVAGEALSFLGQRRNPLLVIATGGGKTRVAADVVRRFPGRVLWLAHRIELVKQGIGALEEQLGERVDAETVESYSAHCRVVVASKDTIRTARRLDRLKSYDGFDLIVIDEAHHIAGASYWSIINAYPNALRLGLTATPSRLDKLPLRAFDCATTPFGIVELSQAGWLVPIRAKRVKVKTIDLSGVSTVAGDFNQGELDAVYRSEANLHAIAGAILERLEAGPCLHFATSVDVAERQTEVLNRYRPGVARFVSGKTPAEVRQELFRDFGRRYSILVNVGVATEGTDLPLVSVVSIGRPTKSPSLFQQMLGRGLRPLPGLVDGIATAQQRLAAIQQSRKPRCLVLDFVGNTGRHSVQTAVAAFEAGPDQAAQGAAKAVQARLEAGEELDIAGALAEELELEQERQQKRAQRKRAEQQRRLGLVGKVELTQRDVMLIGLGGQPEETDQVRSFLDGPPSPGQVTELSRLGVDPGTVQNARQARDKLQALRKELDYASPAQLALIAKRWPDLAKPDLKRGKAGYLISQITKSWR